MKTNITIKFTEPMLGTKPSNKEIFGDWVASKAPDGDKRKEELDSAEHAEEGGTTVFARDNGEPGIYDYQIKGFFKDACAALNRSDSEFRDKMEKLSAYKTKIDQCIFVYPRFIKFTIPEGSSISMLERPLRADTPQGPRIALARSEIVPVGTTISFELQVLSKDLQRWVQLCLDYGKMRGIGQWRNASYGRFTWSQIE